MYVDKKTILNRIIAEKMADKLVDKYIDAITLSEESAYHIHFRKKMKQHGVTSIGKLSKDKKKTFFSDVRRSWHAISGKIGKRKIYEGIDPEVIKNAIMALKRSLKPDLSPDAKERIQKAIAQKAALLRSVVIQGGIKQAQNIRKVS